MKIRIQLLTIIMSVFLFSGCSSNAKQDNSSDLTAFRETVDTFCNTIAETDQKINSIDTASETYGTDIITSLNLLDSSFAEFAAVDFPEEYDYLEHLADEASDYMTQAVAGFTKVYSDNSLSAEQLQAEYDNAAELYNNAFKRIKVIMTFLNGETSEDANVSSQDSGTLTSGEESGQ